MTYFFLLFLFLLQPNSALLLLLPAPNNKNPSPTALPLKKKLNFQICSVLPPLSPVAVGCEFRFFLILNFPLHFPPAFPKPQLRFCLQNSSM
ncbi:hypothetical protein SLEP1_g18853 [Rubroshorea leprosula]|uniref:Secreted protein n=1 Tax=Rubroshorea leprosula TaxID=152421 RepID=A0AAV5JAQ7_9ROSI|nr:hypothetical protein SLEP1_g18853 [Rubroshorea leprosula]